MSTNKSFKAKKKKFILHIGTNKTGTTAIQTFLFKNRKKLAEKGINYPNIGIHGYGHHNIARALGGQLPSNIGLTDDWIYHLFNSTKTADQTILSSELFHLANPESLNTIFPRNDTLIILYLRDHFSYLTSWYQQAVQLRNITSSFTEFIRLDYTQLNYSILIDKWMKAFNNVSVRSFDRNSFPNGCVIEDFCRSTIPTTCLDRASQGIINPSIAGNLLFFKLILNNFINDSNNYQYAGDVKKMSSLDKNFQGKISISEKDNKYLNFKYKEDKLNIQKKYSISFPPLKSLNNMDFFYNQKTVNRDFKKIISFAKENNLSIYKKIPNFLKK